jgi:hypothetical protein
LLRYRSYRPRIRFKDPRVSFIANRGGPARQIVGLRRAEQALAKGRDLALELPKLVFQPVSELTGLLRGFVDQAAISVVVVSSHDTDDKQQKQARSGHDTRAGMRVLAAARGPSW